MHLMAESPVVENSAVGTVVEAFQACQMLHKLPALPYLGAKIDLGKSLAVESSAFDKDLAIEVAVIIEVVRIPAPSSNPAPSPALVLL